MQTLKHKKILLGITGSIAAYKSAELIRLLKDAAAEVRVVMTENSKNFITPLTLASLSGQRVCDSLLHDANPMIHIELARWAELVLIAPASANFMAKLVTGFADDLLSTICLATSVPIAIAPAMNQQMWQNPMLQKNLQQIKNNGVHIIGPAVGIQACGEYGFGRMLEPETIIHEMNLLLQKKSLLAGKRVLITAGPTQEAIDPVRFLSNHSSGKMGFALAEAALAAGAEVTLISGPCALSCDKHINRINIISAQEMLTAVMQYAPNADIFIAAAAVADYRVEQTNAQKIKKINEEWSIKLVRNPDILQTVAKINPRPFVVGFSAETENLIVNAEKKLRKKKLDMMVANEVNKKDRGFYSDYNELLVITNEEQQQLLPYAPKKELAFQLIEIIASNLMEKRVSSRVCQA